jgi:hypothetical protein
VCSLFGTNLILIALVNFEYTFVLNPTATDGCGSSRIYLNSTKSTVNQPQISTVKSAFQAPPNVR